MFVSTDEMSDHKAPIYCVVIKFSELFHFKTVDFLTKKSSSTSLCCNETVNIFRRTAYLGCGL